ncbi:MAG: hypothetical protein ACP5MB_11760, partial [bacterium]
MNHNQKYFNRFLVFLAVGIMIFPVFALIPTSLGNNVNNSMSLSNYFYESFNSSLTANLNALRNFSIQNNLSLNVGTLAINITNSFNVFFPFIELFNFTEFQNNFSWDIEHNFTDNVTLVNFAITMDEGQNETMY